MKRTRNGTSHSTGRRLMEALAHWREAAQLVAPRSEVFLRRRRGSWARVRVLPNAARRRRGRRGGDGGTHSTHCRVDPDFLPSVARAAPTSTHSPRSIDVRGFFLA